MRSCSRAKVGFVAPMMPLLRQKHVSANVLEVWKFASATCQKDHVVDAPTSIFFCLLWLLAVAFVVLVNSVGSQ